MKQDKYEDYMQYVVVIITNNNNTENNENNNFDTAVREKNK